MTILLYDLVGEDAARPFSPHCWKTAMRLAHKGLDYRRVPTVFTSVAAHRGRHLDDGAGHPGRRHARGGFLHDRALSRRGLSGPSQPASAAKAARRWRASSSAGRSSPSTLFANVAALTDIHARLAPPDQAYFRDSREKRYGKTLEDVSAPREAELEGFRASLTPLRNMLTYQPFIGGDAPLYPDYIVFGAFQWVRVMSPFRLLADDDPIAGWFERLLDMHGGLGRSVAAA